MPESQVPAGWQLYLRADQSRQFYLKRDPGTGVSCKFCEISKETFSYRTLPVAASSSSK